MSTERAETAVARSHGAAETPAPPLVDRDAGPAAASEAPWAIRPCTPDDGDALGAIILHPDVAPWLVPWSQALPPAWSTLLDGVGAAPTEIRAPVGGFRLDLVAVLPPGEAAAGEAQVAGGAHLVDGELVYYAAPHLWGRGLGRSLVRALCAEARRQRRGTALHASVLRENVASRRVLEASGFRLVDLHDHAGPCGRIVAALHYEWR